MSDDRTAGRSYGDAYHAVIALGLLRDQFARLGFIRTKEGLAVVMKVAEAETMEHFTARDRQQFEERRRKRGGSHE